MEGIAHSAAFFLLLTDHLITVSYTHSWAHTGAVAGFGHYARRFFRPTSVGGLGNSGYGALWWPRRRSAFGFMQRY